MERMNQIMSHKLYQYHQQKIEEAETNRRFCRHGLEHALDVARILYIKVLEKGLSYSKDVVYAAAFLHDIGRNEQYQEEIPHHEAGARIAEMILSDCDFSREEILLITAAVRLHQTKECVDDSSLNELLYQADKLSRACYRCKMREECYWSEDKKNKEVLY